MGKRKNYFKRAQDFYGKKEFEKAMKDFDKAVSINQNTAWARRMKGWCLLCLGRYDEAVEVAKRAINANPKSMRNVRLLGACYREMGEFDKALEKFDESLELKSDFFGGYASRALCYFLMKKYQHGLDDCNMGISLKADFNVIYNHRGLIFLALGELEKAKEDYHKATYPKSDFFNDYQRFFDKYKLSMMMIKKAEKKMVNEKEEERGDKLFKFLSKIQLEQFYPNFKKIGITFDDLELIEDDEDLEKLIPMKLLRKKFLREIERLNNNDEILIC